MYSEDFKRKITHGKVAVSLRMDADLDPDPSYLGEAIEVHRARQWSKDYAVYSYETDSIRLPGSDVWRDRKGRITAEPESLDYDSIRYHRETEFLKLESSNYAGERSMLTYLFQDADRLRAYYRGDWLYVGIVAIVHVNGREIGNASTWGIESDSDDPYFREMGREVAHEAIAEARQWLESLAVA